MSVVLRYQGLNSSGFEQKIKKIAGFLQAGNFRAADVKKLAQKELYRAKLDDTNRLLFKLGQYNDQHVILLLEVIRNHRYDTSRFLRGVTIDETKIPVVEGSELESSEPLRYYHKDARKFCLLDKVIIFDPHQEELYQNPLPLIIVGSAGSGKTAITLEKMKHLSGDVLYVTASPYLVESSRSQYFSNGFENPHQSVEFLSFHEYLSTFAIPEGKEVGFDAFAGWFARHKRQYPFADANQVFEEFKGVLTGSIVTKAFLSREDYLNLGVKQSIFTGEQRPAIYELFEKYRAFLRSEGFYDANLLSFNYLEAINPTFDAVVIDEVQDFTMVQLKAILQSLKKSGQFILCGDSNQIVHPNFFSWAKIKSYFYQSEDLKGKEVVRVLSTNYRGSKPVTELANQLLKIKRARFGSIDRESNYLIHALPTAQGAVHLLKDKDQVKKDIDQKTKRSTQYAVLVMRDEDKKSARKFFHTPLIFSIREAKGLEYENVILFNLISENRQSFKEIIKGVKKEDLEVSELRYARSKDKEDKSLEIFKFFINALYVAVSRSVKNLYFIEQDQRHELLELLGLKDTNEPISLDSSESSLEDWQREARKLELQGKAEQAAEIRRDILKTEPVPWEILDKDALKSICPRAYDPKSYDKKAQRMLFAYGHVYHDDSVMQPLVNAKFGLAKEPKKADEFVTRRFMNEFSLGQQKILKDNLRRYGIDYLNPLGQTPLMTAVRQGKIELATKLVQDGSDLEIRDLWGARAFEVCIKSALSDPRYAKEKLAPLYELLSPGTITIQSRGRLIKLQAQQMEYFLLTTMLLAYKDLIRSKANFDLPAFQSADLMEILSPFEESVLPARRKKRAYLSHILAKNEVHRSGPYNRELFLRVGHRKGYYLFNPALKLAYGDDWVGVYDALHIDLITLTTKNQRVKAYCEQITELATRSPNPPSPS